MESLRQVVATLRREVLAALDEDRDLPAAARLEAERVVLSLSFSVEERQAQDGSATLAFVVPPSSADGLAESAGRVARSHPHTLTVEFRLASASRPAMTPLDQRDRETAPAKSQTGSPKAEEVTESLVCIFGVPGFDSSARATVFREALAGLSDDQARAIIDSLRGMPTPGITPAAARARQLMSRLLESGPGGPTRGREALVEIFRRHTVESLIRLVRDRWKTQEDWLDEPVERPSAGRRPPGGTRTSGR